MKLWKKLQNPYALVGQGFVMGGALFFATHPAALQATSGAAPAAPAVVSAATAR
jgi:hypothetical protein